MNPGRFEALAGAFGGEIERWPAADREPARRLTSSQPEWTALILGEAQRLDQALGAAPTLSPSGALLARILQAAPGSRERGTPWRWLAGLGLTAGLAGAVAAGVAAGLVVAPAALAPVRAAPAADPSEEAALLLREPADLGEG